MSSMAPYQDSHFLIKVLETRNEIEEALRIYSRIAVKSNPLIISLNIDSDFYYDNYCKLYLEFLFKEQLSVGAYDLQTKKLICFALAIDLFSEAPKDVQIDNLHHLLQKEEALCIKGLEEFMKEGIIKNRKNCYFYEIMAATEDGYRGSKVYFKVSLFRIKLMLDRGFEWYYGELTTPKGIRAWIETIKPNYVKKIDLETFEWKGKKVYEGVDWSALQFKNGEAGCFCVLKKFSKDDLGKMEHKPKL